MDILFKVVNNVLIEDLDLFYEGGEGAIRTFGPGFYFSLNSDFVNDYVFVNEGFSLKLKIQTNLENLYTLKKEDLPEEGSFEDFQVFIKGKFVDQAETTNILSNYDFILIDNHKEIVIIPKNKKPNLSIISVELITFDEDIKQELKNMGINILSIPPKDFKTVDSLLKKIFPQII